MAKYTAQLADHQALRVPEKVDTKLTPDIDYNVKRDLGDIVDLAASLKYAPLDWVNVYGGVNYSYKARDKLSGTKFSEERYDWMAIATEQNLATFQTSLELHTINLYKKKKFKAPMKIAVSYSDTLQGKNATSDALYSLNLSLFF